MAHQHPWDAKQKWSPPLRTSQVSGVTLISHHTAWYMSQIVTCAVEARRGPVRGSGDVESFTEKKPFELN